MARGCAAACKAAFSARCRTVRRCLRTCLAPRLIGTLTAPLLATTETSICSSLDAPAHTAHTCLLQTRRHAMVNLLNHKLMAAAGVRRVSARCWPAAGAGTNEPAPSRHVQGHHGGGAATALGTFMLRCLVATGGIPPLLDTAGCEYVTLVHGKMSRKRTATKHKVDGADWLAVLGRGACTDARWVAGLNGSLCQACARLTCPLACRCH